MADGRVLVDEHRHLFAKCRVSRTTLVLHGVSVHSHLEALLESAGAALVAMCLINLTQAVGLGLANILAIASN